MPPAARCASGTLYWHRGEVEEWVAANDKLLGGGRRSGMVRPRGARPVAIASSPGPQCKASSASHSAGPASCWRRRTSLRHVAVVSGRNVWLRTDVERYLLGK